MFPVVQEPGEYRVRFNFKSGNYAYTVRRAQIELH